MDHGEAIIPNPWMMLPFGLLLAMIALGPLFFLHWWEKHYPKVASVSYTHLTLPTILLV